MLLDSQLAFSTDQDMTGAGAARDSENILDTEIVNPNLGEGGEIGVMVVVKTTFAGGTDLQFDLYHGTASADTLLLRSPTFAQATLVSGYSFFLPLPKKVSRFLKLIYNQTGDFTAGTVDAYLTVKQ